MSDFDDLSIIFHQKKVGESIYGVITHMFHMIISINEHFYVGYPTFKKKDQKINFCMMKYMGIIDDFQ